MKYSRLISTGSYLPTKVVTNDDLAKIVDTSHDWIVQRSGISSRHIADDEETVVTMGTAAAQVALKKAQLKLTDIDMILVATCSSDMVFPATACMIQKQLGLTQTCPAFDIQAACAGFVYALATADSFIKTGLAQKVLVIGTEVMSKTLDWSDRRTCVLFGDGAGAVILGDSTQPGVLSTHLAAQGYHQDVLFLRNSYESQEADYLQMSGSHVFKLAVKILEQTAVECLQRNHLSVSDLDWLIPHQANIRIIHSIAKRIQLPLEKIIVTVNEHGNTSGASIPLALDHGFNTGQIKFGQHLLLEAFGGGLTWGSCLIRYLS